MTNEFFESYKASVAHLETTRQAAKMRVEDVLESEPILVHEIHSRLKKPESLVRKFRTKRYEDPWHDITDIIGVRVILYYNDHVDLAVAALKKKLGWSRRHTIDKTENIGSKEFGYRSFHIVAELPKNLSQETQVPAGMRYFEIQVRSVLAHTWAQIEHEIVYKSGIKSPDIVRRFSAISGTLEILEREFVELRESLWKLVSRHKEEYSAKAEGAETLDSARLIAAMSVHASRRPSGWGGNQEIDSWLCFEEAKRHLDALGFAGVTTWNSLRSVFGSQEYKDSVVQYALEVGAETQNEISHRTMVQIAALTVEPRILTEFADLFTDEKVLKVMQRPKLSPADQMQET
jgi:ppGpp synthetase/RelA/SpoT-type nucleotidyltranferase